MQEKRGLWWGVDKRRPPGVSRLPFWVSSIALGLYAASGVYDGKPLTEEELYVLVKTAIQKGVNYIDTAFLYGIKPGDNESLLGRVLVRLTREGFCLDRVIIGTKCGFYVSEEQGLYVYNSYDDVIRSCNASLQRLKLESAAIGIYWLHRLSPDCPITEIARAMADLIKGGKVIRVGLSEVNIDQIEAFRHAMGVYGYGGCICVQGEYSLVNRDEEAILTYCLAKEIPYIAYSPLAHGLCTCKEQAAALFSGPRAVYLPQFDPSNLDQNTAFLNELGVMAGEKGLTIAQLMIAYVIARGAIALIGPKRVEHLEESVKKKNMVLSRGDIQRMEAIMQLYPVKGERAGPAFREFAPGMPFTNFALAPS